MNAPTVSRKGLPWEHSKAPTSTSTAQAGPSGGQKLVRHPLGFVRVTDGNEQPGPLSKHQRNVEAGLTFPVSTKGSFDCQGHLCVLAAGPASLCVLNTCATKQTKDTILRSHLPRHGDRRTQ